MRSAVPLVVLLLLIACRPVAADAASAELSDDLAKVKQQGDNMWEIMRKKAAEEEAKKNEPRGILSKVKQAVVGKKEIPADDDTQQERPMSSPTDPHLEPLRIEREVLQHQLQPGYRSESDSAQIPTESDVWHTVEASAEKMRAASEAAQKEVNEANPSTWTKVKRAVVGQREEPEEDTIGVPLQTKEQRAADSYKKKQVTHSDDEHAKASPDIDLAVFDETQKSRTVPLERQADSDMGIWDAIETSAASLREASARAEIERQKALENPSLLTKVKRAVVGQPDELDEGDDDLPIGAHVMARRPHVTPEKPKTSGLWNKVKRTIVGSPSTHDDDSKQTQEDHDSSKMGGHVDDTTIKNSVASMSHGKEYAEGMNKAMFADSAEKNVVIDKLGRAPALDARSDLHSTAFTEGQQVDAATEGLKKAAEYFKTQPKKAAGNDSVPDTADQVVQKGAEAEQALNTAWKSVKNAASSAKESAAGGVEYSKDQVYEAAASADAVVGGHPASENVGHQWQAVKGVVADAGDAVAEAAQEGADRVTDTAEAASEAARKPGMWTKLKSAVLGTNGKDDVADTVADNAAAAMENVKEAARSTAEEVDAQAKDAANQAWGAIKAAVDQGTDAAKYGKDQVYDAAASANNGNTASENVGSVWNAVKSTANDAGDKAARVASQMTEKVDSLSDTATIDGWSAEEALRRVQESFNNVESRTSAAANMDASIASMQGALPAGTEHLELAGDFVKELDPPAAPKASSGVWSSVKAAVADVRDTAADALLKARSAVGGNAADEEVVSSTESAQQRVADVRDEASNMYKNVKENTNQMGDVANKAANVTREGAEDAREYASEHMNESASNMGEVASSGVERVSQLAQSLYEEATHTGASEMIEHVDKTGRETVKDASDTADGYWQDSKRVAENAGHRASGTFDEATVGQPGHIYDDIADTRDYVVNVAADAGETARQTAENVADEASNQWQTAKQAAAEAGQQAMEAAPHIKEQIYDDVQGAATPARDVAADAGENARRTADHIADEANNQLQNAKQAAAEAGQIATEAAPVQTELIYDDVQGAATSARDAAAKLSADARVGAQQAAESTAEYAGDQWQKLKETAGDAGAKTTDAINEALPNVETEQMYNNVDDAASRLQEGAGEIYDNAQTDVHQTLDRAGEYAGKQWQEARRSAADVGDRAAETYENANIGEAIGTVQRAAKNAGDDASRQASNVAEQAKHAAQEQAGTEQGAWASVKKIVAGAKNEALHSASLAKEGIDITADKLMEGTAENAAAAGDMINNVLSKVKESVPDPETQGKKLQELSSDAWQSIKDSTAAASAFAASAAALGAQEKAKREPETETDATDVVNRVWNGVRDAVSGSPASEAGTKTETDSTVGQIWKSVKNTVAPDDNVVNTNAKQAANERASSAVTKVGEAWEAVKNSVVGAEVKKQEETGTLGKAWESVKNTVMPPHESIQKSDESGVIGQAWQKVKDTVVDATATSEDISKEAGNTVGQTWQSVKEAVIGARDESSKKAEEAKKTSNGLAASAGDSVAHAWQAVKDTVAGAHASTSFPAADAAEAEAKSGAYNVVDGGSVSDTFKHVWHGVKQAATGADKAVKHTANQGTDDCVNETLKAQLDHKAEKGIGQKILDAMKPKHN
ncbi:hypothetical protein DIPPA_02087 [Diplonema papillatum]|nr:hypothetical protein DIPPA_02087 [Diplonema papillatum]